jgi:hypothetical protein
MKKRQPSLMVHTNPEFETSNLILDFEFDQHLESHKHVINIIMWFRDMGCYRRPLKVAQDVLHGHQMGLSRVMHVQTDLMYDVCDVRPTEHQVLESSCDAPKLRGNRGPESVASFIWRLTRVLHDLQSTMTACSMTSSV